MENHSDSDDGFDTDTLAINLLSESESEPEL